MTPLLSLATVYYTSSVFLSFVTTLSWDYKVTSFLLYYVLVFIFPFDSVVTSNVRMSASAKLPRKRRLLRRIIPYMVISCSALCVDRLRLSSLKQRRKSRSFEANTNALIAICWRDWYLDQLFNHCHSMDILRYISPSPN